MTPIDPRGEDRSGTRPRREALLPRPPRLPRPPAPKRRSRTSKVALSEQAVVDAGIRILQRQGLDAVTMRAVGTELDTGAASLYVYVAGRDELCQLMFARIASAIPRPEIDPPRWREQLRQLLVDTLDALEAHPGIATFALGNLPSDPSAMDGAEVMLALVLAGGVDPQRAAWACDALFLMTTATAVETLIRTETDAASPDQAPVLDPARLAAFFDTLSPERYPNLVKHSIEMTHGDTRERFLFAIDTFVNGLGVGSRD